MIPMSQIEALSQQIVDQFQPDRIILFGSYAYGVPTQDSDVDLMVVMPFEGHPSGKAAEILNATDPRFSVDLLVRTARELENRIALGDFFLREIVAKGKILYSPLSTCQDLD
jgi:uncharacterized protein